MSKVMRLVVSCGLYEINLTDGKGALCELGRDP